MPVGLPTFSLPIADLMADPFLFAVPVYQRPYSWTDKEAEQLLDDVITAAGVDSPDGGEPDYFLGSILLLNIDDSVPAKNSAPSVYEIIDGQQRLVTIAIIAAALRDLEAVDEEDALQEIAPLMQSAGAMPAGRRTRFRIELRGRQQAFIEECVLAEGGCSVMKDEDSLGEAEKRIFDIRERFIAELSDLTPAQRLGLARYLKNNCYVVVMLTHDLDRAHRMFLVLNGRGKPLSRHDILKAEILNRVPPQQAERALTAWDTTAARLDEENFEAFFSHVRAIHGHYRPQVIAGIRTIIEEVGGPTAFIETVFEPLAAAYQRVLNPEPGGPQDASQSIRRSLAYMHRVNGAEWMPAAMVAFQRHAADPARLAQEIAEIERFAHIVRLLCLGHSKRQRRFSGLIEALRAGRSLREEDGPCRMTRDERRTLAYNLRDLHGRNPQVCKLVLMRLNDDLAGRFIDLQPSDLSIEHVLPQRTGQASPWRGLFPDGEERDQCIRSLGNLLLVTPRQNDRARNQEFVRKREIYAESKGGALEPLSADVIQAAQWRATEIRAREMRLMQAMERIWRLDLVREPAPPTPKSQSRRRRRT